MAEGAATTPLSGFGFTSLSKAARRGDVVFAMGLMCILTVLILPMPKWLLDVSLAISLMLSMLVLTTALFIERPLEFSSFPTMLLVSTMMRLALNVASTRLILGHGHEGQGAAGDVIRAFGNFIMQGNFVIGLIVFAILVVVNFVVITKGSGRIAEVSARFSLDAMPGKQMAIDADLSAGLIKEVEAKERRKKLEDESNFYGAMDGAAKFVRGDAIAGLVITFINIIGGIIIGVAQMNLTLSDAASSYTVLTVGDGLVSQIPALIVSTAAGILVSKAGVEGSADKALFSQLSAYPSALGLSSFLMLALSLLPGIPMLPFLLLAIATGALAWKMTQVKVEEKAQLERSEQQAQEKMTQAETQVDPIKEALTVDPVRLELGFGLLTLVKSEEGQRLADQIHTLRKQLASELGFVLPTVRLQDNLSLQQEDYVISINDIDVASGSIRPHALLCMNPEGSSIDLGGEETREPTFGLNAKWIQPAFRNQAEDRGYTVVEPVTVIMTHMTETIKDNISELLGYHDTQKLLEDLDGAHQKLLKDICPTQITTSNIQRVLQNLLAERISIRNLGAILEAISEATIAQKDIATVTEHVRSRLARQICAGFSDANGILNLVSFSPDWENELQSSLHGENENQFLSLAPSRLHELTDKIKAVYDEQASYGMNPVLLTSDQVRPHLRRIVERFRSSISVISHSEIHPKARIQTVATIE